MIAFKIAVILAMVFVLARLSTMVCTANRSDINRMLGVCTDKWDNATAVSLTVQMFCGYACTLALLTGIALHLFQ